MLSTILATCMLGTVLATKNSTHNGVTLSVDTSMIQQIQTAYWYTIQEKINEIKVPDFVLKSDTADYAKDNDFTITQPTYDFTFENDVKNNCFQVTLNDLTAKFVTNNFHAHSGVFGAHGEGHMDMNTVKLVWGLRPITQTLEDGRKVPGFESCNYDFDSFDKDDLEFSLKGSFWDGFIDAFKFAYEDKIVDAIKGGVKKALTETLPDLINSDIAKTDGLAQLKPFNNWYFDFDSEEAGFISDTSINLGARGILFDSDFNETLPETWPEMPYKDSEIPSALQVFASDESINSLLASGLQVTDFTSGWFNATQIPAGAKFNLTTGYLDKLFKGMKDHYGSDCPVDVYFSLDKLYGFEVTSKPQISLSAGLDLQFWVETVNGTELAVELDITNLLFQGHILIVDGYNIATNITKLQVKNVDVIHSTIGKIGTFKL